eukprot:952641-Pelagomonas_calceolata.AAC.5
MSVEQELWGVDVRIPGQANPCTKAQWIGQTRRVLRTAHRGWAEEASAWAGLQGFAHCALCFMNMSTDNVWIWTGMDCFAHTHDISGSGHYLSIDYQLSLLNSD